MESGSEVWLSIFYAITLSLNNFAKKGKNIHLVTIILQPIYFTS